MKFSICFLVFMMLTTSILAQRPMNAQGARSGPSKTGRLFGKVVDDQGKGVGYATVQLMKPTSTEDNQESTPELVAGQITDDNGDFSLDKIPVGQYKLFISFIGFTEVNQTVSFDNGSGGLNLDKDLGNISLVMESSLLNEVTVKAEKAAFTLAIDKKEYRVDQDATTAGGDAVDALRNIPSLQVDLEGNVRLRNGAPQIFVDGRPTTLTLDQISADMISTVEVITNPSAKYDAGGGSSGIINIVLKKEKRLGYNGSLRAGGDTQGGINLGANINARAEKTNLFASTFMNKRIGQSMGELTQRNLTGEPLTVLNQMSEGDRNGTFGNIRAGVDWFMDNRNTITFNGSYTRGKFDPSQVVTSTTDFLYDTGTTTSSFTRTSDQERMFKNIGGSVLFKHLFPKAGAEWTADATFNRVRFEGVSDYESIFSDGLINQENQNNLGISSYLTLQTDFIKPISDKIKIEGGLRASIRNNTNEVNNSFFNYSSEQWEDIDRLTDAYRFTDNVYAAYGTFSHTIGSWAYQAGLRMESSFYSGTIVESEESFNINYPSSFFPSLFVTKKLNDMDNLQFALTRRINRPNFFQTLPFTDISNPQNPRRGNVQLRPEFTTSLEMSYQKIMGSHNMLVSVYYKQANDLITTYLIEEFVPELGETAIVTTFANSNSSSALGAEITVKNSFGKKIQLTSNVNLYNSRVDASNVETDLVINRFSWFLKENLSVSLPKGFSLQLSGQYVSRASFTPSDGRQRGFGRGSSNSAQGYQLANWQADAALRKSFMNRKLTVTLNISDIFATRRRGSYTETDLFIQDSVDFRVPQVVRFNVRYTFGKSDARLFKRKNTNQNSGGGDIAM